MRDTAFDIEQHLAASERDSTTPISDREGYDLLDIGICLLAGKRVLVRWTLASVLLGLCIAVLQKSVFTATSVIMPPKEQQSAAASLIGDLGPLGNVSAASSLGLKNPGDIYVGILQSRIIADDLISRFDLLKIYDQRSRAGARNVLSNNASFEAAKNGLIYIKVKAGSPQMAAALANGFVDELHSMNSNLAKGEAMQRRVFFDDQLGEEKKALASAEEDLRKTEEKTGIIQLSGQEEMTLRSIASVRAELANSEVDLGIMRTFATDQSPGIARRKEEIASRKGELQKLESDQRRVAPGDVDVPAGRVPLASLEYLRKLREVKYHEVLSELLAKQQVAASMDEAKLAPLIQVIDPAEVPERRSGPPRLLITAGFGMAGLLVSAAGILVRYLFRQLKLQPEQATRVEELRRAFSWRGR